MSVTNHEKLLESSVQSALAAIEIYNKPDFSFREGCFLILSVKSWEALLKAKIVLDARDDLECISARRKDGSVKLGRSGNTITIDVLFAAKQLQLDPAVLENLKALVELRDSTTHLYLDDSCVKYLVFALGVASLRNYQSLISTWFNRSLLEYNFYILPLAFAYSFQTLSPIDLDTKPSVVANILRAVDQTRSQLAANTGYHFVCELATSLISAKRLVGEADLQAALSEGAATQVVLQWQRPIDKYPLSYSQLVEEIKAQLTSARPSHINALIKGQQLKANAAYSYYSFETKAHEERYKKTGQLPTAIASIYNHDAVRFLVSLLGSQASRRGA